MISDSIIHDTSIVILAASVFGSIFYFLRQPIILGYIFGGILIGPLGFDLISQTEFVNTLSSIGILLLLYLIGIDLEYSKLKDIGGKIFIISILQVTLCSAFTFAVGRFLGFDNFSAFYIGLALSFSSTVVVVKMLLEKEQLDSLYGKVCVGILIMQDIIAVIALLFITAIGNEQEIFSFVDFSLWFLKGLFLSVGAFYVSKYFLGRFFHKLNNSGEIIMISGISWCLVLAFLFEYVGYSREIGAFIAGLALSSLPYSVRVSAKAKILRDFFITMFFVALGASLHFPANLSYLIRPLIFFSLIILVIKPLIIGFIMGAYGFVKRTCFLSSISLSQISEFSLILLGLGLSFGHVDKDLVSLGTLLMIITLSLSTYMIMFNNLIYNKTQFMWNIFDLRGGLPEVVHGENFYKNHIVLIGCDSLGQIILEEISKFDKPLIVIDENPSIINYISHHGITCVFGDIEDEEILDHVNIKEADLIISTIPYNKENINLLKFLKTHNSKAITFFVAHNIQKAKELREVGADFILLAKSILGNYITEILDQIYEHTDHRSSRNYHQFKHDKNDFRFKFAEEVIKENVKKVEEIKERLV